MRLIDYVRTHLDEIADEFEAFAGTVRTDRAGMNRAELRDHVEQILQAIVLDMALDQSDEESALKSKGLKQREAGAAVTAASTHGTLRQESGFNIVQVVAEYRALRSSVLRLWLADDDTHTTFDAGDIIRFNEAIDQALGESVERYSDDIERARNLFLGMIGHDIRTPLSAISTSAAALAGRRADDQLISQIIGRIGRNAKTIETMVRDLLEFARMRLGRNLPLNRINCDMREICLDAIDDCRAAFDGVDIQFDAHLPTPGYWDPHRLGQMIRNLLTNAVAYGRPDSPIRVAVVPEGTDVVVSVTNDGEVIPQAQLGTLFDPLVRHGTGSPDDNSHLGLGLYIVREIALSHGGTVDVTSAPGATRFVFRLPAST